MMKRNSPTRLCPPEHARYLATNEVIFSQRESAYRFAVETAPNTVYSLTWLEYFEPDATNPSTSNQLLAVHEVKFVGTGGAVHVGNPDHDPASTAGTALNHTFALDPPDASLGNGSKMLTIVKVKIVESKGMPISSEVTTPIHIFRANPYCFKWQYVHEDNVIETYSQDIAGIVEPIGDPFGYHWSVTAGILTDADTAAPTYTADNMTVPQTMTTVTLKLCNTEDCDLMHTNCTLEVYRDHLERDYQNFNGNYCGNPYNASWTFERYGKNITMPSTWNCFGSVWHAYSGTGNGNFTGVPSSDFSIVVTHDNPIDWNAALGGVVRGDFISFWQYDSATQTEVLQHAATFINSSQTYGANNFPGWGFVWRGGVSWWGTTWQWWRTTPQAYYDNVNEDYGSHPDHDGEMLVNRIRIHKRLP
ncbi:MAG: hypothetical protein K9N49_02545 [Candidatus Marinimicrobia bacterium]|nr:hypothetical protein [Candidatus Neomarinimicrobiota bacterium]